MITDDLSLKLCTATWADESKPSIRAHALSTVSAAPPIYLHWWIAPQSKRRVILVAVSFMHHCYGIWACLLHFCSFYANPNTPPTAPSITWGVDVGWSYIISWSYSGRFVFKLTRITTFCNVEWDCLYLLTVFHLHYILFTVCLKYYCIANVSVIANV